jgi:iron complex transport system permease protein
MRHAGGDRRHRGAGGGTMSRRPTLMLGGLVAVLFVASLVTGPAAIGPGAGLWALIAGGDGPVPMIMREIRLPRALLGAAVGAALGLSGAALQGYLRNPLAEPGLIGVGGAAGLGAVLAIQSGLAAAFVLGLPLAALAGAGVAAGLVLWLAGPRGGSIALILAGIAISSLAGALTALALSLSPNPFAVMEITFWMMGSLADRSMTHVWLALPFVGLGAALLLPLGRGLDALTLGEDAARALGTRLTALRLRLVAGVALAVGAATAVAGVVGFVGLVAPHLLRPLVGGRPGALLGASALGGAAMVLAADVAARLILPRGDLKLGVLTALVGAPLFLHLIWKTRGQLG